jgi:hypothetical protein
MFATTNTNTQSLTHSLAHTLKHSLPRSISSLLQSFNNLYNINKDDWTVGVAEKAGYIYLSPIVIAVGEKRSNEDVSTKFRVVVPLIFYGFFTEGIVPGDLLDIEYVESQLRSSID